VADLLAGGVNRYITRRDQATAYKVGQPNIREVCQRAEQRPGAKFDLHAFHDAVLENGPVPLDALERLEKGWMEKASGSAAGR
jgi:uncharacterized protein (DUF885 family)